MSETLLARETALEVERAVTEAETAKQTELRRQAGEALYQGAIALGFGCLVYGGFWLYRFVSDLNSQMTMWMERAGVLGQTEGRRVHPKMRTESVAAALNDYWRRTKPWHEAEWTVWMFADLQAHIDENGYMDNNVWFNGYDLLKSAEREAIAIGAITSLEAATEVEPEHPLDRVASFVLTNRYYWAGVLGLTALPGGIVAARIAREQIEKVKM